MDRTARLWDVRTGRTLVTYPALPAPVTTVGFSPDESHVVAVGGDRTVRVWATLTTRDDTARRQPTYLSPRSVARSGRLLAHPNESRVELIDLGWDGPETARRWLHTQPDPDRAMARYLEAAGRDDSLAATFWLDRMLANPQSRTAGSLRLRNRWNADPRLAARGRFHHPELARTPSNLAVVQVLAAAGDRLARRIVAQQRLSVGQPREAIPLLVEAMLMRPAQSPPVEELLLARAYLLLNQRTQAVRYYRSAVTWLDRRKRPVRAASMVTHALRPWNALGVAFLPIDDPRYDTFDWESWHECDVFRAQVERLLAPK